MIKIEDKTGEIKETILDALRFEFDDKRTTDERLKELVKAANEVDKDSEIALEMTCDLENLYY